jgi:hypothetical protein
VRQFLIGIRRRVNSTVMARSFTWKGCCSMKDLSIKTNIVTSVEVSDGYAHDYPFYKGLVDRTANAGFQMKEVSADKGYLGATNMLATLQHGAIPYIPFKINSVADSRGSYGPKSELWTRMYHFYSLHRASFYSTITNARMSKRRFT